MIEVQPFIPVAYNSGTPFSMATDELFRAELDGSFGGSSELSGTVSGRWVSGGQTYIDENRVFMVLVTGLIADGAKILAAVAHAKSLYSQLALTVRYLGVAEIL